MEKLISHLSMPWPVMRILRLVMGIYITYMSFNQKNYAFTAIGVYFMYQAVFNAGCGACQIPQNNTKKIEDVD